MAGCCRCPRPRGGLRGGGAPRTSTSKRRPRLWCPRRCQRSRRVRIGAIRVGGATCIPGTGHRRRRTEPRGARSCPRRRDRSNTRRGDDCPPFRTQSHRNGSLPDGCAVCGSDDVQYVLETDVDVDASTLAASNVVRAASCSIDCVAEKLVLRGSLARANYPFRVKAGISGFHKQSAVGLPPIGRERCLHQRR